MPVPYQTLGFRSFPNYHAALLVLNIYPSKQLYLRTAAEASPLRDELAAFYSFVLRAAKLRSGSSRRSSGDQQRHVHTSRSSVGLVTATAYFWPKK